MSILQAQVEELELQIMEKEEALAEKKSVYEAETKEMKNEISVLKRAKKSLSNAVLALGETNAETDIS